MAIFANDFQQYLQTHGKLDREYAFFTSNVQYGNVSMTSHEKSLQVKSVSTKIATKDGNY